MTKELGLQDGITAVFFDLVGTLIRSRGGIGDQYAERARRFGAARADSGQIGRAFHEAMRTAPVMAFPGRSLQETAKEERAWWRDLVQRVVAGAGLEDALHGERFDAYFQALYSHFATGDAWETYPDAIPALRRLHARGLIVGLITNYDTRVYPVLDALGLAPLLDPVTIPAVAGAAKPDPAIFASAMNAAGVAPGQTIYVGDELGDDYAGALSAGMMAILIDRDNTRRGKGVRRIVSLDELAAGGGASS